MKKPDDSTETITELEGGAGELRVRALFLGERLDLRGLDTTRPLGQTPLTIRAGEKGHAVLFRYGTVVLFGMEPAAEGAFLERLKPLILAPFERPESEESLVRLQLGQREGVEGGVITLGQLSLERLQVIADVLAKSTVLAYYEAEVAQVFDRIEPLAERLRRSGTTRHEGRELVNYIGGTLLTQHRTVGRVAILEKPEVLWEHSELERLYARLSQEYELRDRQVALEGKVDLIARTAQTLLDLLQSKRSLRVEWYIVLLIVVEILLTLYDMFLRQ